MIEDGTSAHRVKATQAVHDEYRMESLVWVPSSPDLNLLVIKVIWRIIKAQLNKRANRATTAAEVCQKIQEKWNILTQTDILELIDSMPEWIAAVITANGGHTKY